MRKRLTLLIFVTLVAAACASGGSPSTNAPTSSTTAPSQVTGTANSSTTAVSSETTAPSGSEPRTLQVPDFTLELSDGSTFTLSEERRPVYLLFWAEW